MNMDAFDEFLLWTNVLITYTITKQEGIKYIKGQKLSLCCDINGSAA